MCTIKGLSGFGETSSRVVCTISTPYIFRHLEKVYRSLDVDSSTDMLALHYIYIPLINQSLHCFVEGWCHHKMRTENNRTPLQLWISGSMARMESGSQEDCCLSEVCYALQT